MRNQHEFAGRGVVGGRARVFAASIVIGLFFQLAVSAPASAQGSQAHNTRVARSVARSVARGRAGSYVETKLVADNGGAAHTDPNLINSWGIAHSPTGAWQVADNGTGVSTAYNGQGVAATPAVTIPGLSGGKSAPTGIVFNDTRDFVVSEGARSDPSAFVFATEDGTISGWNSEVDATHAILEADNSARGAVYKGLALGSARSGNVLYATDFHNGAIDVFDARFHSVTLQGSFTDPALPSGFAPFGIRNIDGRLYVTYAKQKLPDKHDDESGPGNGFVDIFTTDGSLVERLASHGTLNSPWGLALAPSDFGRFSGALLIGNFGDGRISALKPRASVFLGQLTNPQGQTIVIDGLWGLDFGNGAAAGPTDRLFFASGPNGEAGGLFGSLSARAAAPPRRVVKAGLRQRHHGASNRPAALHPRAQRRSVAARPAVALALRQERARALARARHAEFLRTSRRRLPACSCACMTDAHRVQWGGGARQATE